MRIALFCNEYPPRQHGGIGTFTAAYARGLLAAGHTPTVVEFGPDAQTRDDDGVRIVTLPVPSRVRGTTDLRIRFRLWRWAASEAKLGLLNIFELPEYDGMMPFPLRRCVGVVRLHLSRRVMQHDLGGSKSFKSNLFENLTLRCNRNWIGVSKHILKHTQAVFGLHPRHSTVVLNPVADPNSSARVPMAAGEAAGLRPYVLFVGYVGERKGALLLAEAVKTLLPKHPDLRVAFVGREDNIDGQPASERIRAILGNEFSRRAHFTGPRPRAEVLEWMRGAAIVCLPSRSESFGLVPVEAMMLGRPVIYSDCGPGREIVEDGVTGLLCNLEGSMSLTAQLDRFLSEPKWAETIGANAQRIARERFSMEQCVTQSLAFYQELMSRCAPARGNK